MDGWMIRLADYYLEPVHKMMKLKDLIKYPRENFPEDLKKLMPWSEELPDSCRKNKIR